MVKGERVCLLENAEKELVKATFRGFNRVIILWLLSKQPSSGYRIVKELKKLTNMNFYPGTVYPLLYELEQKGLIKGEWSQKSGRRIKYYSITSRGTKLLDNLRDILEEPVREALKDLVGK